MIIARSRSASSGETWSTSCSFCSTLAGVAAERDRDGVELALLHRDALARRERLELVQRAEVRRDARILVVAAELGDGVTDAGRGCGGEHQLLRRRTGHELRDVDPTRSREHPEVALGDGYLAALVRHQLAPAQTGASRHFRQRETLLPAHGPQVLAQLLRRDGESIVDASAMALRIGDRPAAPVGSVDGHATPWATSSLGSIPRPTSTRTRRSSGTSPSAPAPRCGRRRSCAATTASIIVGARTSVQDGAVLHTTPLLPTTVGRRRRHRSPRAPRVLHRARRCAHRHRVDRAAPRGDRVAVRWWAPARSCPTAWSCPRGRWRSACPRRSGPTRSTWRRRCATPRSTCGTVSATGESSAASTDAASRQPFTYANFSATLPSRTRSTSTPRSALVDTVVVGPRVAPLHGAAISGRDDVLAVEVRGGRRGEELLPCRAHLVLTLVALTARGRRVLEHAVVGHGRHHRVDIVAVERVVEAVDRGDGGVGRVGHRRLLLVRAGRRRTGRARSR